jgi:hypothetical protein
VAATTLILLPQHLALRLALHAQLSLQLQLNVSSQVACASLAP